MNAQVATPPTNVSTGLASHPDAPRDGGRTRSEPATGRSAVDDPARSQGSASSHFGVEDVFLSFVFLTIAGFVGWTLSRALASYDHVLRSLADPGLLLFGISAHAVAIKSTAGLLAGLAVAFAGCLIILRRVRGDMRAKASEVTFSTNSAGLAVVAAGVTLMSIAITQRQDASLTRQPNTGVAAIAGTPRPVPVQGVSPLSGDSPGSRHDAAVAPEPDLVSELAQEKSP